MKLIQIFLLSILITGCSVLQPVADSPVRHLLDSSIPERLPTQAKPVIAIARPSLPPYLERPEWVTRTKNGRLEIHDQHLWAEPLDAGITRVVADNLRRLTGSTNIQAASSFITREYSALVEIRIDRFGPEASGILLLECTWKLQPTTGGDASPKFFVARVPIKPSADPMGARLAAMNKALEQLSRAMKEVLPGDAW